MTAVDFYYLESDGQVFLVEDGSVWRFPKSRAELPCAFEPVSIIPIQNLKILFAKPKLKKHPTHWFHKDEIPGRTDIDPIVQLAVNRSLPRAAAKVIIVEKGKVLLVKAKRGLTKDIWNLPGGFVGYTEHPKETAERECEEELGIRIQIKKLIGTYAMTFDRTGGYMISFIYEAKRKTKHFKLHPEEIGEIRWTSIPEAIRITPNPFAVHGLKDFKKSTPS